MLELFCNEAEPEWLNWSHDKDYILGLADRLCHIPNLKP